MYYAKEAPTMIDPSATPTMSAEQELRQERRRQMRSLMKAKNEFIAISSHQLRTPATCVKIYLGIILDGYAADEIPEPVATYLRKAYDSNEKQLSLLNNILQVAQIDSGNYILNPIAQNACDVIHQVIKDCQEMVAPRGQRINYKAPEECKMVADTVKMKIVLFNLIENASKNSPEGSDIDVSLSQTNRYIRIRVRDHGAGIEHDDVKRIFQKFTHVENKFADTINGNGLGLYIAKKITKLLGGTLTVTSRPAEGSVFTITFKVLSALKP